jgi:pre-mRNA-processing factor 8
VLSTNPQGFSTEFGQRAQLLLSDKFKGYFLVPDDGLWNYAFMGAGWSPSAKFDVKLDTPIPYYHELHRPLHFNSFKNLGDENIVELDKQDVFA